MEEWNPAELARTAELPRADALREVWAAQGLDGLPVLVREDDRPAIVDAGHTPAYRAINGAFAAPGPAAPHRPAVPR